MSEIKKMGAAYSDRGPFGQLLMMGFPGSILDLETISLIRDHGVGNFILFKRNVVDPAQVRHLCGDLVRTCLDAGLPWPLVAVDQEGGVVQRLGPPHWSTLPGNGDVGQADAPEAAASAQAKATAQILGPIGILMNLAPVLDVAPLGAQGVLARRSYGVYPERVATVGAAYIKTLQAHGIGATAKHFPGIGRAVQDPHEVRPMIQASREILFEDLTPFRKAVTVGILAVMTSHVVFPALDAERPATFSKAISQDLLRKELGFEGLLLTDDLEMGGITAYEDVGGAGLQALLAGHDLILVCHRAERVRAVLTTLRNAWRSGYLPGRLIEASLERLARTRSFLRLHRIEQT